MGAYMSEPVTEKISSDDESARVRYGASSMQGWRITQEDAHNCLINFDKDTSLFAVYDGHGGHEVAVYCSQKLPDFIKSTEAYKKEDFENALIDAFLGFDASISTREIVEELKEIAGVKDNGNEIEDEEDEENMDNLYKEASMPIEQIMEKYQNNLLNPQLKKLQGDKLPVSPMLKAPKGESSGSTYSSSGSTSSSSSSSSASSALKIDLEETSVDSTTKKDSSIESNINSDVSNSDSVTTSNGDSKPENEEIKTEVIGGDGDAKPKSEEISKEDIVKEEEKVTTNGETNVQANGDLITSPKGKGKAIIKKSPKTDSPDNKPKKNLRVRNAKQLYSQLLEMEEESDSEDESDTSFEGVQTCSSSEEATGESSEGSADDEEEEEEVDNEEDVGDDEEDIYEENEQISEFTRNMTEEPGSDSGCTAVVALLRGNQLYVANAGDSRCVVSRNGQAIEMSFDHKPEDEPEMQRVIKAGGQVTTDGRVNGGLNLSRAIGDHAYKQNKTLPAREQMITALPDIKTLTINPAEDEFMVLACDGIWNFMSSQEVVDFVKPRLKDSKIDKLSQICEQMFDHCLAPNTDGDGTGCDNMTAVIVQFKNNILKRSASPEKETSDLENSAKRAKTETTTVADDKTE